MKRFVLLVSFIALLAPTIANAQTPVAIEGLEVIAERQYATDTQAPIDTSGEGVFLVSARVYLFDALENAESTWETLVAAEPIENDLPEDDESYTYEKSEREDIGDRATVLNINSELQEGESGVFRIVIAQRDTMIITVTVIAGSDEAATIGDDIAAAMIDRDPDDSASEYDGLGISTGGVWEVFLPADADTLQGLQAYSDKETRPARSERVQYDL